MTPLEVFLIGVVTILVYWLVYEQVKKVYLNKGYVDVKQYYNKTVESPKFKIDKIEYCYACNTFDKVAKYTAECWYKTKKDVENQKVIFYDAIGKYNVGDELELTIKNKCQ